MKHILLFISFYCFLSSYATTVNKKLYILSDSIQNVDLTKSPYKTFNETNLFTQDNPILEIQVLDSLNLWVVNFDTITHEFAIKGIANSLFSIPVGDSIQFGKLFTEANLFIYYDPLNFPTNSYLGLSGMLIVKDHNYTSFYWNIKEHDNNWNTILGAGGNVDWSIYKPKYFTINSVSNPNINLDTKARITGNVGQTLILNITNTGQAIHSLHFHGYHAVILKSSKNATHVGREKDTFPIYPMETLVIKIIPDKPGEYPVHDHNLVAIAGNNIYPNGMFSTILILP